MILKRARSLEKHLVSRLNKLNTDMNSANEL